MATTPPTTACLARPGSLDELVSRWDKHISIALGAVATLDRFGDAIEGYGQLLERSQTLYRGESSFHRQYCRPRLAREPHFDSFEPLSNMLARRPTSIQRDSPPETTPSVILREEVDILDRFRQWFMDSNPRLRAPARHATEWLDLAQHFGAPTRLLDTTTSPLIALFFACWSSTVVCDPSTDGVVYVARLDRRVMVQTKRRPDVRQSERGVVGQKGIADNYLDFFEPWVLAETRPDMAYRYRPLAVNAEINRRLAVQSGEFLWRAEGDPVAEWCPIVIPGRAKADLLRRLAKLRIDPRLLFPDKHGVGWHRQFEAWLQGDFVDEAPPRHPAWAWPGADDVNYQQLFATHRPDEG